ncbi:hypothetical protein [Caproiciproducens faecalis]|uniref:hypothetical protein n=1 Tax=Caproiciproducens faecalis TaxID=2820301 RepID=UPI0021081857|nr:hypothetical protein [Caproiciproducens faecalis]
MSKTVRLAFCGIITAICTMAMFLTGLISIGTYALPAFAGILLIVVVIELGAGWAWPVYLASSLLSLLLAGDKEAAMLFIIFFGYYPILKAYFERIHQRFLSWLLKFAVFNAAMILGFFLSIKVLGVPEDSFTVFGVYLPWAFLAAGNCVFVVYDYAISSLVGMYFQRFHRFVGKWLK